MFHEIKIMGRIAKSNMSPWARRVRLEQNNISLKILWNCAARFYAWEGMGMRFTSPFPGIKILNSSLEYLNGVGCGESDNGILAQISRLNWCFKSSEGLTFSYKIFTCEIVSWMTPTCWPHLSLCACVWLPSYCNLSNSSALYELIYLMMYVLYY